MLFVVKGDIDNAIDKLVNKGWQLIERGKGNEDAWIVLSDPKGVWVLFRFRAGKDMDGINKTIVMYHSIVDRHMKLF